MHCIRILHFGIVIISGTSFISFCCNNSGFSLVISGQISECLDIFKTFILNNLYNKKLLKLKN